MKINARILTVADCGDKLRITAQGNAQGSAEWRPYCSVDVSIPMSDRNRRSFYTGRKFTVTIEPK